MRNNLYLPFLVIILIFVSCKQEQEEIKFNQSRWNTRNDIDYNHRELMIEDLSKNYLKPGMKFTETERLLGKNQLSEEKDSLQLRYEIYTDYGSDIAPIETKTLIVSFNSDSTLTSIRVDHWEK
ncbi:hypothetical protein [Flavobacterium sp. WC2509]|uniref:hypothetical protein n=1 Tax=Flavobacterium sp. WC2509 TaxID=3461406 RepID=UPI004044D630